MWRVSCGGDDERKAPPGTGGRVQLQLRQRGDRRYVVELGSVVLLLDSLHVGLLRLENNETTAREWRGRGRERGREGGSEIPCSATRSYQWRPVARLPLTTQCSAQS